MPGGWGDPDINQSIFPPARKLSLCNSFTMLHVKTERCVTSVDVAIFDMLNAQWGVKTSVQISDPFQFCTSYIFRFSLPFSVLFAKSWYLHVAMQTIVMASCAIKESRLGWEKRILFKIVTDIAPWPTCTRCHGKASIWILHINYCQ